MKESFNVLLSSVGRRSYLVRYFRDALGDCGKVVATNCVPKTPGMVEADEPILVPPAYEDEYIPVMLQICKTWNIKLLFSLHDLEAFFLAPHIQRFKDIGTLPVLAPSEFVSICFDKYATAQFAMKNGFRTGKVFLNPIEACSAVRAGEIGLPLVLKPRNGYGSIGFQIAYDLEEIEMRSKLLRADILRTDVAHVNEKMPEECVLIQQQLHGVEYGLDVINNLHGTFVACIVKRKTGMRSGETDAAEIVDDPNLHEMGRRIGELSRHLGVLDVDIFVDNDIPYLLEINPRFGGHYPFAHEAGANIPAALIAWARKEEPNPSWLTAKPGVRSFKDIALVKEEK
ncbi:ATP-grasp domain-containing protein [Candidatus Neomarinimicrobiota bacterium]